MNKSIEKLKILSKQMKMEIQQKFIECSQSSSKKEVHINKCLPGKQEKSQINLTLHIRELENEAQS